MKMLNCQKVTSHCRRQKWKKKTATANCSLQIVVKALCVRFLYLTSFIRRLCVMGNALSCFSSESGNKKEYRKYNIREIGNSRGRRGWRVEEKRKRNKSWDMVGWWWWWGQECEYNKKKFGNQHKQQIQITEFVSRTKINRCNHWRSHWRW